LTFQHLPTLRQNLVKLGHARRYGAHFEDLDEANPSKVLQEAISLHLISNVEKTAFLPCQNSVKMSSAVQQVPFPLHESPRPLIPGMLALTSWSKTLQPSKQMHLTFNEIHTTLQTVDRNKLQQNTSTAKPEHFHHQALSQSSNTASTASKAFWVVGSSPVAKPLLLDLGSRV
jgi:hypothetical protein